MSKLTIILGKGIGEMNADLSIGKMIRFPEIKFHSGSVIAPQHPDNFVPQTMEWIRELMIHGKDVQLWTMSEYLVSAIAQDVEAHPTYWQGDMVTVGRAGGVVVRLYEDDNCGWQDFGIDVRGRLCDIGYGNWPIGWFLPK